MGKDLTKLSLCALFVALSIILGKFLAITLGFMRFSLENTPVILAGVLFGPLAGALVGIAADLVGSLLVGYAINPLITLGAGAVGFFAGLIYRKGKSLGLAIFCAHLIGSCIIKSFGLYLMYSYPVPVLLFRLPLYGLIGYCDYLIIKTLLPRLNRLQI